MIQKKNIPLSKVSWLSNTYNEKGYVRNLFYPESLDEFQDLVKKLIDKDEEYVVVGHTSNIYFMPDYVCDNMIATKLLNKFDIKEDSLVCECGVKVTALAKTLIENGFKGFEGLVDLPGTLAGGLYGNAGCYGCHVADNLEKIDLLRADGEIVVVNKSDMKFAVRSSVLKRKELNGVILKAYFRLEKGDKKQLQSVAVNNHKIRKLTQPGPTHNLGSIFVNETPTLLFYIVRALSHIYGFIKKRMGNYNIIQERKNFELFLMGGASLPLMLIHGIDLYGKMPRLMKCFGNIREFILCYSVRVSLR